MRGLATAFARTKKLHSVVFELKATVGPQRFGKLFDGAAIHIVDFAATPADRMMVMAAAAPNVGCFAFGIGPLGYGALGQQVPERAVNRGERYRTGGLSQTSMNGRSRQIAFLCQQDLRNLLPRPGAILRSHARRFCKPFAKPFRSLGKPVFRLRLCRRQSRETARPPSS